MINPLIGLSQYRDWSQTDVSPDRPGDGIYPYSCLQSNEGHIKHDMQTAAPPGGRCAQFLRSTRGWHARGVG